MSASAQQLPPGAYRPPTDVWGGFARLARRMPREPVVVLDARVARLHPEVRPALARLAPRAVITVPGGEAAKSFRVLERILVGAASLPRAGALVAIGGGTIGDVATVAAHLLKRGVGLHHVPTTVLAAVDSSLGGKGAVDVTVSGRAVKNLAGVFHTAEACWLCPEFFTTLSDAQRREGAIEAWKMAVCLDASRFHAWCRRPPPLPRLVREARTLKESVVREDPYERTGLRKVLNFGHTFGHVLESVSRFRLAHGEAVGLGMVCALDVGRALGVTPEPLARSVEEVLQRKAGVRERAVMARLLARSHASEVGGLLATDKKAGTRGELQVVLLAEVGRARVVPVAPRIWQALLPLWRKGVRP
ncbi:MAG: 3-dehydroquinate synthase [Myxococcaceae bacterium]|nr:3-dehydroquinate synthase [Myxococcaceae bacterium]MCI0671320.1 3-dehydroquinate synthase [Myxococcaceae bacterium]